MTTKTNVTKKIRTSSGARFLVNIDHEYHRFEFEEISNKPVYSGELIEFLMADLDAREELKWALEHVHECGMFFWRRRYGRSGCMDLTLYESDAKHAWAATERSRSHRVLRYHISMASKLNDGIPDMSAVEAMLLIAEIRSMEMGHLGIEFREDFERADELVPSFAYEKVTRRADDDEVICFPEPIRIRPRRRPSRATARPLGEPCL